MKMLRTMLVALATGLAAGACAPAATVEGMDLFRMDDSPARDETTVEVTNRNWSDMVVYVVRSGSRFRIGSVTAHGTTRLRIPTSVLPPVGGMQLMFDPIGSTPTYTSEPIQVRSGQRVAFTIEQYLPSSSFSVWDR